MFLFFLDCDKDIIYLGVGGLADLKVFCLYDSRHNSISLLHTV